MGAIENFNRLMASFDEETLKRMNGEFEKNWADPNFKPVPLAVPKNAGPFGMTLQQIREIVESTQGENERLLAWTRQQLREVLDEVSREVKRSTASDEVLNRDIVELVNRRLSNIGFEIPSSLVFFEEIADLIRQKIMERAESAATLETPAPDDTVKYSASLSTTFLTADSDPQRVLTRLRRLAEFASNNRQSALIYSLAEFAGRTSGEIAELLTLSPAEVLERLKWAITEVTLDG